MGTKAETIKDDKGPPTIQEVLDKYHPAIRYTESNDLRQKVIAWRIHYQARIKATDAVFEVIAALLEGAESWKRFEGKEACVQGVRIKRKGRNAQNAQLYK